MQLALCSLRMEMRELLEGLRQETSSRVRILKERLDRTDRELLRQLEDAQNNDRSDKFDALVSLVETKADKVSFHVRDGHTKEPLIARS